MTLTINVPPNLEQLLRDRAAGRGQALEAFVLEALRQFMAQTEGTAAPAPSPVVANPKDAEEAPEAPWRGVFTVDPPRKPLFTEEVNLQLADLPRWQPEVVLTPRATADDDE